MKKKSKVKTKLIQEAVTILIKVSIDGLTDTLLEECLQARCGKNKRGTLVSHDSKLADELYDSSDKAELRALRSKADAKDAVIERKREDVARGSKFLSTLGHKTVLAGEKPVIVAKAEKHKKVDLKSLGVDRKQLNKYLPKVTGCTIQPDVPRRRFTTTFPGALPGSRSRTWSLATPRVRVLKHVYQWVWAEHFKKTKEPCPYNWAI